MRFTLLALASLLLAGCTAAPATPPETPTPAPVGTEGVYDFDFDQFTGVYVIVDGEFWGLHFLGDTLAGHPHGVLSDANTALNREPIGWANFVDDGRRVGTMESAGTLGRTFTDNDVTVAITGSMGSFSAKATQQKQYSDGSPIFGTSRSIDGGYAGAVRTVGIDHKQEPLSGATIEGSRFTATAVGCSFDGTLTERGTTGLFAITVLTSGAECLLQPELGGIVVALDDDSIAVELDTTDATQSAVFVLNRE